MSGRPPKPGGSATDDPIAWRRSGRPPKDPSKGPPSPPEDRSADPPVPYAELHCHSAFSFLDGASTPEQLVAEALRLGLSGAGDHRPRRPLRHRPVRRGGDATPDCAPSTARSSRSACRSRRSACPIRWASTCWCSPAVRRDTAGCRCRSARAQLDGGEKGRPVYDLDGLADVADGHWADPHRMPQGQRPAGAGPGRAGRGEREIRRADRPFRPGQRRRRAHQAAGRRPTTRTTTSSPRWPPTSGSRWSRRPARTTPTRPRLGVAAAMAAVRARRQPGRGGPLPARRSGGAPALRRRDGARCSARYPSAVRERGRARRGVRIRPALGGTGTAPVRRAGRPRREQLPAGADHGRALAGDTVTPADKPGGVRADREGTGDHRGAELSRATS